jgi:hypothetical protein
MSDMADLRPLVLWLRQLEAVIVRKDPVTYQDPKTGINYQCVVERLFEHNGEVWVLGRCPGSGMWTGAPVVRCSLSEQSQAPRKK